MESKGGIRCGKVHARGQDEQEGPEGLPCQETGFLARDLPRDPDRREGQGLQPGQGEAEGAPFRGVTSAISRGIDPEPVVFRHDPSFIPPRSEERGAPRQRVPQMP